MSKLSRRSLLKALVTIGSLGTVVLKSKDAKASSHRIFWATKPGEIAVCPNMIVEKGDPVKTLLSRLDMLFRVHEGTVDPQRDIEKVSVKVERSNRLTTERTIVTPRKGIGTGFSFLDNNRKSNFDVRLTVEFRKSCPMRVFELTHPGNWYHQHVLVWRLASRYAKPVHRLGFSDGPQDRGE